MNVKKYIKNYKKNSFKIFSGVILTFILMISFFYMDSYANEDKVIRVGIFNFDGFYQTSETGIRFGYGYDYLNEIAKYKGYSYEFVEGDWDELFLMLQNGEIDLMNMVQKTPDRETTYQFSEFSTGMSYGGVYVRADDENFAYGDIQSLDGKRIGFLKDNSRNEEFFFNRTRKWIRNSTRRIWRDKASSKSIAEQRGGCNCN